MSNYKPRERIGRMLRYMRLRRGYTISAMARRVGLSRRMIYLYEQHNACPSAWTRKRLYDTVMMDIYGATNERDRVYDELCHAATDYSYDR